MFIDLFSHDWFSAYSNIVKESPILVTGNISVSMTEKVTKISSLDKFKRNETKTLNCEANVIERHRGIDLKQSSIDTHMYI